MIVKGSAKVVCYDNRVGSKTKGEVNEFFPGEKNPALIQIPPYVVHGFKAIGGEPVYVVNAPTEPYKYEKPGEYRIPPDSPTIPYNWDVQMKRPHTRSKGRACCLPQPRAVCLSVGGPPRTGS